MYRTQKPTKHRPNQDKEAKKSHTHKEFDARESENDLDPRSYNLIRR